MGVDDLLDVGCESFTSMQYSNMILPSDMTFLFHHCYQFLMIVTINDLDGNLLLFNTIDLYWWHPVSFTPKVFTVNYSTHFARVGIPYKVSVETAI